MICSGDPMRPPRKMRTGILLLCAICAGAPVSTGQTSPIPPIPGWTLTTDSTRYTPRNLWDFIDGAAEVYLSYGFVDLAIGDYARDSLDIRVEAYRHSSPTMAFGIYSTERKPDYHFIEIATQGYQEEGVLNFLSGEYYLKLSTHSVGEPASSALRSIADRVATHLDRPRQWPRELRYLPEAGRCPNTEGFVAGDFLGYSFFENAFTAQYGEGTGSLLFVIEFGSRPGVDEVLRKYTAVAGKPESRNGGMRFADPNNGPVTLLQHEKLLFGVVNAPGDSVEARYISLLTAQAR